MDSIAIIPAFNEAMTVAAVVEAVRHQVSRVLVVDDGSTDDTGARAAQAGAQVHRHEHNQGKAAALVTGLRQAMADGAERVITLDGDGQHPAHRIAAMIELSRRHPEHVIIGARTLDRRQAPFVRRFANRFADFWVSWAAGMPYRDTQSGLRLYPAAVARQLPPPHRPEYGFAYESEILIALGRMHTGIIHLPIETLYPEHRRPSYYRAWRDTSSIVRMVAVRLARRGFSPLALLRSLDRRHLYIETQTLVTTLQTRHPTTQPTTQTSPTREEAKRLQPSRLTPRREAGDHPETR